MVTEESEKRTAAKRKKVPKKITQSYLHNYALFYLERFSSSSANLKNILLRRARRSVEHHGEPPIPLIKEWIDTEIENLIRLKLLDDELYARSLLVTLKRKGMSKRALAAKAAAKGVNQSLLRSISDETSDENSEFEAAGIFCRRKKLGINPDNYKKDMAAMARAGFSYDIACRTLKEKV